VFQQLERRDPAEDGDEDVDDAEDEGDDEDEDESDSANEVQEEDAEEDAQDEDDPELRRKLEEAFGKSGLDEVDEDEELMDDEQMMAIDEQLAEIFKSRSKDAKGIFHILFSVSNLYVV
jgi:DNA polymerase phi